MKRKGENKKIYIVLSQTGTMFAKILKMITGDEYNHASISLDKELTQMYSFGRKVVYNPFDGGFIHESLYHGVFGKFKNTKAMIVSVDVTEKQMAQICSRIAAMNRNKEKYKYNFRGLFFGFVHIPCHRTHHFYCSEFVKDVLQEIGIDIVVNGNECVKPAHLLQIKHKKIYTGNLHAYKAAIANQ